MLDKGLPIPLYHQLHRHLLARIQGGELKPDDRLASEEELATAYGVSKITVRHALQQLALAGYVRREQGRGTFVAVPKLEQGPRKLTSFTEEMQGHGHRASSRVVSQAIMPADGVVAATLELPEGADVFRLERLRLADGEPMGLQTAHIPVDLAPGLAGERFDASSSLYEILRQKYGLAPARARETHYAVGADREVAALLRIPEGSPVMAAERITLLGTGRPLELVQSVMRGDRYKILLDLTLNEHELRA